MVGDYGRRGQSPEQCNQADPLPGYHGINCISKPVCPSFRCFPQRSGIESRGISEILCICTRSDPVDDVEHSLSGCQSSGNISSDPVSHESSHQFTRIVDLKKAGTDSSSQFRIVPHVAFPIRQTDVSGQDCKGYVRLRNNLIGKWKISGFLQAVDPFLRSLS